MKAFSVIALAALTACMPVSNDAPVTRTMSLADSLPPMKTFAEGRMSAASRPNSQIIEDFLDLSFRLESGRPVPKMTRFEAPISVRFEGAASAQTVADLRALLNRLRDEAAIDIFLTGGPEAAITIQMIPRAELQRAVPRAACFVVPRVANWQEFQQARRTPQVDWTTLERRDRAAVFVPADVSPQEVRDCLHEELAQAIGPLNDLYRLPDSIFNDDNIHAVLTPFDMLVLRTYYSPDLRNGMSRGEAAVRLPALLARLNPSGEQGLSRPMNDTSRDWIEAVEVALDPGASPARRRSEAEKAINLARAFGWSGPREAFALFAYGRLEVGHDPKIALGAFQAADRSYRESARTQAHVAHVAVQLAAFSLSSGDAPTTLRITQEAAPIAQKYQNASLLATLLMFEAEALEMLGRDVEAQAVRLDSLSWARYGFGTERNVRARLQEVASLNPSK